MKRCLILPVIVLLAGIAAADEIPALRPGMWEFTRTLIPVSGKPQTMSDKICADPTAEMKRQNVLLTKAGCKFTPVQKKGKSYIFQAACTIQGVAGESTTAMTVESDSAYRLEIETRQGKRRSRETLTARRVGDCPK